MLRNFLFLIVALICGPLRIAYALAEAGTFTTPVAPAAEYYNALGFLDLNKDFTPSKYHLGEDWNAIDGLDYGDPVYAIADGVVVYTSTITKKDPIGKVVIVRHTLPTGEQVDSVHYHLKDVLVKSQASVIKGQKIATIGNSNGYWSSHLHFELRRDLTLTPRSPAYYQTMDLSTARKYKNPSLFINDRKFPYTNGLSRNVWSYIPWNFNAPSSTTYVEVNGKRYSLQKAVDSGVIYKYVYVQIAGNWYYYPNISDVFFTAGNTYAIYSFAQGATINILVPGDRFRDERARQDMMNAAAKDGRFTSVKTDTYNEDVNWDPSYELRWMRFSYATAQKSGEIEIYHATLKTNPLVRYTSFYDPITGQPSAWASIDWNVLD